MPVQVWRVSPEVWVAHDCTLAGIMARCGGRCCRTPGYWPPLTGEAGVCPLLGEQGCTLTTADRPVTCLLYPLRLRGDLLVLHHRTRMETSVCAGNHGVGPPLWEAMRPQLVELFGERQWDRVRSAVSAGVPGRVYPSQELLGQYRRELMWEHDGLVPGLRSVLV